MYSPNSPFCLPDRRRKIVGSSGVQIKGKPYVGGALRERKNRKVRKTEKIIYKAKNRPLTG